MCYRSHDQCSFDGLESYLNHEDQIATFLEKFLIWFSYICKQLEIYSRIWVSRQYKICATNLALGIIHHYSSNI